MLSPFNRRILTRAHTGIPRSKHWEWTSIHKVPYSWPGHSQKCSRTTWYGRRMSSWCVPNFYNWKLQIIEEVVTGMWLWFYCRGIRNCMSIHNKIPIETKTIRKFVLNHPRGEAIVIPYPIFSSMRPRNPIGARHLTWLEKEIRVKRQPQTGSKWSPLQCDGINIHAWREWTSDWNRSGPQRISERMTSMHEAHIDI
jgi:hypothetical protein